MVKPKAARVSDASDASSKFKCWLDELDVEVETRCQQMTHHVDQLVMTLSCHYGTQMLKLPKTVKQMKMKDFVAKYGCDIEDISDDTLRAMLAQYDVDPMPMRQPLAPLSVSKNTGIQKISSAKKDTSKTSILATPGKGASSASAATPAYSKWTQRLSSVTGATPVRAASTYGSSSSSTALSWSSIKARLPKKGDQIQSSNGSPIDTIVSDTAAQLLFDKENHISQLVVQTGAKQCVDICNPEAAKALNARDKLKVQSKIEAMQRQMNQLLEQLQAS